MAEEPPDPDILNVLDSPDFASYSVASIKAVPDPQTSTKIPLAYQKLLKEFESILTPNFREVKHSIVHSIPTGNAVPVRTKARPLLPGSPKAIAGKKAWDELIELGIVEKVRAEESHYWSSALHLQTKADGSERPCGDFRGAL